MSQNHLLIVDKTSLGPAGIEDLPETLARRFGLDAYAARQRLLGRGIALLAEAPPEKLAAIAALLGQYRIEHWLVEPTPPRFAPARVQGFRLAGETFVLVAGDRELAIERDTRVLGILADLSGAVVDRDIKRLLVQNAYRGAAALDRLDADEIFKTALQNQPILDLYLLDDHHGVRDGARIFSGRFDPQGLGEHKSHSVAGNLKAILRLVSDRAADFVLRTDFGLAVLPGCGLNRVEPGQVPSREQLAPLTRFGWLMADLWRVQTKSQPLAPAPEALTTAAAVLGVPAAVAMATAAGARLPGLEDVADAIDAPAADRPAAPPTGQPLPLPPELPPTRRHSWRRLLQFGLAGAGVAMAIFGSDERTLARLAGQGLRTGILPALLAGAALWGGFYYLRLKRQLENLPTSKARSVAMGMVEVRGRARRKYALVSPMTQQPCVYYRLRKQRRNDDRQMWEEYAASDCGPVPFEIEDETGRLTVDPQGATLKPRHRQEGLPGSMSMLLMASAVADPTEKWIEEIIPEGAQVFILGCARAPRAAGDSLRERTVAALRELKRNRHRMTRYDTDGDGRIGADEWQAARTDVEDQVLRQTLGATAGAGSRSSQTVVGRPDGRGLPFIIAETESEAHLTRDYALAAVPLLICGVGLGIFALARLAAFFGRPG